MFKKLKAKASQPLTYGWLWKCYVYEAIAACVICGGTWIYEAYQNKKLNEADAATMDYNKFEDSED